MRSGQFKGVPVPRKAKNLKVFSFIFTWFWFRKTDGHQTLMT